MDGRLVGRIGAGLLLLVGFRRGDAAPALEWMAEKVVELRIFPDREGLMNRSLKDARGDLLIVSQFTLYGDTRKGRRPSFVEAAAPEEAALLYHSFIERLRPLAPARLETGQFGAMMDVELVNDGPVTLMLER